MKEIVLLKKNLQINNLNINNYIININKFPLLNISDENKITKYFKKTLDVKAANILIITHLRFVVKIARYYIKYGLFINDLIQEGSIGLIKSIKKYDPNKNIRLVTFSVHWIKSEIHNYILKNWKIIKTITTKQQRMIFFNLKKKSVKKNFFINHKKNNIFNIFDIKILDINGKYNMQNMEVKKIKNKNYQDISCNLIENNFKKKIKSDLKKSLMLLDKRSREIIYKRYLSKSYTRYTLSNLSGIFKISKERVRQIEKLAISKLKKYLVN